VKGFTLPHVFQIGRVLPTNWYPPGESMGYMHIYAPPSPTVPSSVNVRAGLYLGTTSLCLHDRYIQIERHTMKRIVDVELYRLNDTQCSAEFTLISQSLSVDSPDESQRQST